MNNRQKRRKKERKEQRERKYAYREKERKREQREKRRRGIQPEATELIMSAVYDVSQFSLSMEFLRLLDSWWAAEGDVLEADADAIATLRE